MSWDSGCRLAGVDPHTVKRWVNRVQQWREEGEPDSDDTPALEMQMAVDAILAARVTCERALITETLDMAREGGKWQAPMTLAERLFPAKWSLHPHFRDRDSAGPQKSVGAAHEAVEQGMLEDALAAVLAAQDESLEGDNEHVE